MYGKYLEILAHRCAEVFQEMTATGVDHMRVKRDERAVSEFAVAQAIRYEYPEKKVKGQFVLGFSDEATAVLVASSIAQRMGLAPIGSFEARAESILSEFMNTIVGQTISEWDKQGLAVRFGAPESLRNLVIRPRADLLAEAHLVILSVGVAHIVFHVTFTREAPAQKQKILVVDDSPLVREVLSKALQEDGYSVRLAGDGQKAVEGFKAFQPDLTIMDLAMPEMGGLDAIREIRQTSPKARIIVLTSTSRREEVVAANTLGIVEYLIKPVKLPVLQEVVRLALSK